jgi:beta-hydroxyacyl-ACP dehydratase FabZ
MVLEVRAWATASPTRNLLKSNWREKLPAARLIEYNQAIMEKKTELLDGLTSNRTRGNAGASTVSSASEITLDINQIQKILPHRPPFLLVDRVLEMEPGKRIVGIKNVTMNEPFFAGHFPNFPVMPGVLIIEAMAQTGGLLLLQDESDPARKLVFFAAIEEAKFRRPVVPGDQLRLEMEMLSRRSAFCRMKGQALVNGQVAAEATLMCKITERDQQ